VGASVRPAGRKWAIAVARVGSKEPLASQVGGPGRIPLSAWFSAVGGGVGRASWSAHRGEFAAGFCSARRRPCRGHRPVRLAFCLARPRPCAGEPAV